MSLCFDYFSGNHIITSRTFLICFLTILGTGCINFRIFYFYVIVSKCRYIFRCFKYLFAYRAFFSCRTSGFCTGCFYCRDCFFRVSFCLNCLSFDYVVTSCTLSICFLTIFGTGCIFGCSGHILIVMSESLNLFRFFKNSFAY